MKIVKGIIDQAVLQLITEELKAQRPVELFMQSKEDAHQLKLAIPARLRNNLHLHYVNSRPVEEAEV